jgi:DNA-binding MarR family transcriptional regulator
MNKKGLNVKQAAIVKFLKRTAKEQTTTSVEDAVVLAGYKRKNVPQILSGLEKRGYIQKKRRLSNKQVEHQPRIKKSQATWIA